MKLLKDYLFRWFLGGFGFGFLTSVIYLLIEGPPVFLLHYGFFEIIGYPGIALGFWFYEHVYDQGYVAAEAFGCVVNGLAYGVLLAIVGFLFRKFRKRTHR